MSVRPDDPQATRLQGQGEVPPTTVQPSGVPPTQLQSQDREPAADGMGSVRSARGARSEWPLPLALADRYDVVRGLPSGGQGYVLLVRDRRNDELRVVKVSLGSRRCDQRVLELLSGEGADFSHVVRISDWDPDADPPWEVMEYCEPGSLADLLAGEGGALPAGYVTEVVRQVFAALEYLHGLRIWHRDLKPANILVRSLEPLDLVLADFGMSHASEGSYALRSRVVSIGYSPPERATSAAGDWWMLGMIVAELALGRNVFQLESGEWVAEEVWDEWLRTRRPLDFSGVPDPRLRRLCEGLTRWDRANRWGAEQVRAWLDGENPPIAVEQPAANTSASVTPFPFPDPHTGRARPFTDPVELAAAMALRWGQACAVLSGASAHRVEQRALRSFLHSLGLNEGEHVLAEQGDVEERLTRLLVALDPSIAPTFRGFSINRNGLASLARATGEGAKAAIDAIFTERVLLNYATRPALADLADLDAQWHDALAQFEARIDAATQASSRRIMTSAAERQAALTAARARALEALTDPTARSRTLEHAQAAIADSSARRQHWYAQTASSEIDESDLGAAIASIALRQLAITLADQEAHQARERQQREAREARERQQQRARELREEKRAAAQEKRANIRAAIFRTRTLVIGMAALIVAAFIVEAALGGITGWAIAITVIIAIVAFMGTEDSALTLLFVVPGFLAVCDHWPRYVPFAAIVLIAAIAGLVMNATE